MSKDETVCGRPYPDGSRCSCPKSVRHGHSSEGDAPLLWRLVTHLEEALSALQGGHGLTSGHGRRLEKLIDEGWAAFEGGGDKWRLRAEQLEVQLAGCLTAAEGHGVDEYNCAKQGMYGWSPAYAAVLELRRSWQRQADVLKAQGPPVPVALWVDVAEPPLPVDGSAWHDHANDGASHACKLCGLDDAIAQRATHRKHPKGGWERLGVGGAEGAMRVYVSPETGTCWPATGSKVWLQGRPGEWRETLRDRPPGERPQGHGPGGAPRGHRGLVSDPARHHGLDGRRGGRLGSAAPRSPRGPVKPRPVECRCDPRFTCGFCLRNAKPWLYTPRTFAEVLHDQVYGPPPTPSSNAPR
jgi:hypothetical protein